MAGLNQIQTRFPKNFAWPSRCVASDRAHYRHIQLVSQVKIESHRRFPSATSCRVCPFPSGELSGVGSFPTSSWKARFRCYACIGTKNLLSNYEWRRSN